MNRFMFTLCVFILSLVFSTQSCKSVGSDPFVGNGVATDDYPAVIPLYINPDNNTACSSFIISSNTLLTAAHCLTQSDEVYVLINHEKFISKNFSYNKKFILNDFSTAKYDIGVVAFEEDIFSDIKPLKLYTTPIIPVNTPVRLVGYGCTTRLEHDDTGRIECLGIADQKRTGYNYTQTTEVCPSAMFSIVTKNPKADTEIKTPTGKNAFTVWGDSGSPLILEQDHTKVIGITSFGIFTKDNQPVSCFSVPGSKENIQFLKEAIQSLKAKIPGIEPDSKKRFERTISTRR